MRKTDAITENYLFTRLYRSGKTLVTPCFALYYRKNRSTRNRMGITATKKIGGAVKRNRARRVITEAYRLLEEQMPDGLDMVFVARVRATQVKMQRVMQDMRRLTGPMREGASQGGGRSLPRKGTTR